MREAGTRAWQKIIQRLRGNRFTARIVGDWLELRDPTLPNELPFVLKDLRVYLYTMINFMLRHEIYKAKANSVHKLIVELGDEKSGREAILVEHVGTKEDINKNMRKYLHGGRIVRTDPDGKWNMVPAESGLSSIGFAHSYYIVLKLMEELKKDLESANLKEIPIDEAHKATEKVKLADKWIDSDLNQKYKPGLVENFNRYTTTVRRFKAVNLIESTWYYFLDMYNLYGQYKRGWRFAKKDTLPDLYTYPPPTGDGLVRKIDFNNLTYAGRATTTANFEPGTHYLIEVDTYGYSTSDINAIQIEGRNLPYIRKWRNKDISHLFEDKKDGIARLAQLLHFAHQDWEFWLEDFEKGNFHPYSKEITDYTELISKGHMNFNLAKFKDLLTEAQIGFDLEAMKNPGEFKYWGRKRYFDKDKESLRQDPYNPYPMASFFGLWDFINKVTYKRVKEPEIAKKYLDYFKLNYREIEKMESQKGGGTH